MEGYGILKTLCSVGVEITVVFGGWVFVGGGIFMKKTSGYGYVYVYVYGYGYVNRGVVFVTVLDSQPWSIFDTSERPCFWRTSGVG